MLKTYMFSFFYATLIVSVLPYLNYYISKYSVNIINTVDAKVYHLVGILLSVLSIHILIVMGKRLNMISVKYRKALGDYKADCNNGIIFSKSLPLILFSLLIILNIILIIIDSDCFMIIVS